MRYLIAAAWGFLTPVAALNGAAFLLAAQAEGAAREATPLERVALLALLAGLCAAAFLCYVFACAVFLRPRRGGRLKPFVLSLFLYGVWLAFGCWLMAALAGRPGG